MKKRKDRKRFYGLLLLLLLLLFTRYLLQIDFPREIVLGVAALILFFGDRDEMIALCMACIPIYTFIPFSITLAMCVVLYVIKYPGDIKIGVAVFPVLLLIIWELLHGFAMTSGEYSFPYVFVLFVPMILCTLLMCSTYTKWDYDFIVRAMALATLFTLVVLIGRVLVASGMDFASLFVNMQRLGLNTEMMDESLMVTEGEINPNTLGVICLFAVSGLLQLISSGRGKKMDLVVGSVLLVFGALTLSKTYVVCLALLIVLLLLAQRGHGMKRLKLALGIVVCAVAAGTVVAIALPYVIETFVARFQEADVTTGRIDLMGLYHEFIMDSAKNLFWGVGLYDLVDIVVTKYAIAWVAPHNMFQEILIAWGIPGLVLIVCFFVLLIWKSRRIVGKQILLNYIPLILLVFKSQAGQMVGSSYTMALCAFAFLSLCQNFKDVRNNAGGIGNSQSI